MTADTVWTIPPSVLRWLDVVPHDAPVAVLMRHSVRGHLPPGEAGNVVPITEAGERVATDLGRRLGPRLRALYSSPLVRCLQTAEALHRGAAVEVPIVHDRHLGDPGVYVIDPSAAGPVWDSLGHERVMEHLVSAREPLPGMAAAEPAARFLVAHMLGEARGRAGLNLFVTHDSVVTTTAARLLGTHLTRNDWPWYLEAAFFWRAGDGAHVAYRDAHRTLGVMRLCGFDKAGVIDFARREVAATIGLRHPGRFFLAGGAFKSLLTGLAPRDLDVWAPSSEDRVLLVESIRERGGELLATHPFAEAFSVAGRVVEVPFKTEPDTLEERLARFDIALSAIGVEHRPGGQWRAVIHPLAVESIERQEVLLLKPLVNWRHALATLARLRHYAVELGFEVPASETAAVWEVFEAQTPEMQHGMIERFDRSSPGGFGVREEALCRLR